MTSKKHAIFRIFLNKHSAIPALLVFLALAGCASSPDTRTNKELFDALKKADTAYSEGNWLGAEQYYQQLIDKVPNDAYAWMRLGNTRLQQGLLKAAIVAYQESILHDPDQSKSYYNLSTAYMLQAQQALEQAQQKLQSYDPGLILISQRIRGLQELSTANSVQTASQSNDAGNVKPVIRYFMR